MKIKESDNSPILIAKRELIVPEKKIVLIDEMTTDKTKACMYVDDNGTDKKITMEDFTASIISALPRYAGRIE